MRFGRLPIVYLSYKEDNLGRNLQHLCAMLEGNNVIHVHGVKGFDKAHKEAARQAKAWAKKNGLDTQAYPYFFTVDGDNRTSPLFWDLDTDHMTAEIYHRDNRPAPGSSVLSWNSYNPVTGLAYGNGGLKMWGYDFVENMSTHEHTDEDTVDFCWTPGYLQLAGIYSMTDPTGSERQAFTAGYREGVKMPLVNGQKQEGQLHVTKQQAYATNLERLVTWCSVGAHSQHGEMCMAGALSGFIQCYIENKFQLKYVSDLDQIYTRYDEWKALTEKLGSNLVKEHMVGMRREVTRKTDVGIPTLGPLQSKFVIERTRPVSDYHNPFKLETWPPKIDPSLFS